MRNMKAKNRNRSNRQSVLNPSDHPIPQDDGYRQIHSAGTFAKCVVARTETALRRLCIKVQVQVLLP
jgi:pyruvoyl-dependent arginine decarboxylase (PvlArgDC)